MFMTNSLTFLYDFITGLPAGDIRQTGRRQTDRRTAEDAKNETLKPETETHLHFFSERERSIYVVCL